MVLLLFILPLQEVLSRKISLNLPTGDLFRYEMGNNTPLGLEAKSYIEKGQLVPDSVTIGMLKNKVDTNPDVSGYIFDGFPRTINQAEALDSLLAEKKLVIDKLLSLKVEDDEIVKRILHRGKTSGRADDNDASIIQNRINVYKQETSPVFDYYAKTGKSVLVEGMGDIDEIFERLNAEVHAI
ncbi:unnamed protein product [Bathycoccus prasinos]